MTAAAASSPTASSALPFARAPKSRRGETAFVQIYLPVAIDRMFFPALVLAATAAAGLILNALLWGAL